MSTLLDLVGAVAAFVASAGLGLRSEMLRERFQSWFTSPSLVRVTLFALSVVMALVGLSICRTGGVTGREAGAYVFLAISAVVLAVNIYRQRRVAPSVDGYLKS